MKRPRLNHKTEKAFKVFHHTTHLAYFGMVALGGPYYYAAGGLFFLVLVEIVTGEDAE